jgi:hypothetical protein
VAGEVLERVRCLEELVVDWLSPWVASAEGSFAGARDFATAKYKTWKADGVRGACRSRMNTACMHDWPHHGVSGA